MNTKRVALFGGGAVAVIAAGLIYSLGIYPPSSARDGQGAIGERQVYRADQPKDATVTPGVAPVAEQANANLIRKGQIFELQNGVITQMSNGAFAIQLKSGEMLPLNNAQFSHLTSAQLAAMNSNALSANLQRNQIMQLTADKFLFQLNGNQFVAQLRDGMYLQLNSGSFVELKNGAFAQLNGQLMQMTSNQLQSMMKQ